jgi:hypothetical protein
MGIRQCTRGDQNRAHKSICASPPRPAPGLAAMNVFGHSLRPLRRAAWQPSAVDVFRARCREGRPPRPFGPGPRGFAAQRLRRSAASPLSGVDPIARGPAWPPPSGFAAHRNLTAPFGPKILAKGGENIGEWITTPHLRGLGRHFYPLWPFPSPLSDTAQLSCSSLAPECTLLSALTAPFQPRSHRPTSLECPWGARRGDGSSGCGSGGQPNTASVQSRSSQHSFISKPPETHSLIPER